MDKPAQRVSEFTARVKDAHRRIGHMCSHGHPPRMSIPARPDEDDDLVITQLLMDMDSTIAAQAERIAAKDAEIARLKKLPPGLTAIADALCDIGEQDLDLAEEWQQRAESAEAQLKAAQKPLSQMSIAELQDLAGRVHTALSIRVLGDPRDTVALAAKENADG